MKKIYAIIIAVLMLTLSVTAFADSFNAVVDKVEANAGDTVDIEISLENNPGIIAALFSLTYDTDRLELIKAEDNNLLPMGIFSNSYDTYPYIMMWNSASYNDFTDNGTLVVLTFKVYDNADEGNAFINISYDEDDVYNAGLENIYLNIENGGIKVNNKSNNSNISDNNNNSSNNNTLSGSYSGGGRTSGSSSTLVTTKKEDNTIVLTIDKKDVSVFGKTVTNDVAPIIRNDRTMLPARLVAESLGAEVLWDGENKVVTVKKGNTEIVIRIGSDEATVNGKTVVLDSAAFIENDRTYTPLRFIAESLGADVSWEPDTRQVIITKK